MPWASFPIPDPHPDLLTVPAALDPVLVPLQFAPGQVGATEQSGQVIFCRGMIDSVDDGCVDLVIDVEAMPEWRIVDVRYWGFPSERWHLAFDRDALLEQQLSELTRTLPAQLA